MMMLKPKLKTAGPSPTKIGYVDTGQGKSVSNTQNNYIFLPCHAFEFPILVVVLVSINFIVQGSVGKYGSST